MELFLAAFFFTIGVSAICSLLEAMFLSMSETEVEVLRTRYPKAADRFTELRATMDQTISSILTLNTIANTLGAVVTGTLAAMIFSGLALAAVPMVLTFSILIFAEIIPKNLGVAYRQTLAPVMVGLLAGICASLQPITWFFGHLVNFFIRGRPAGPKVGEEIAILVDRGAKRGDLTGSEKRMVMNALALHNVPVSKVMTPRTVVTGLDGEMTIAEVLRKFRTIPFGRMPVYHETIDNVTGVVRRRDILHAAARGETGGIVSSLAVDPVLIPESMRLQNALATLLDAHQSMAIVLDEYGGCAGVISIEDILEFLIGREVYELDDPAVDMRQLARKRAPNGSASES